MELQIADLFESVAAAVPQRQALVVRTGSATRRWTYAELAARVDRAAGALAALGVGVGDRIGLHLRNGPTYLEAMLGAFALRAVPVNLNYRYVAEELAYVVDDAELSVVVTEPDTADLVHGVAAAADRPVAVIVDGGAWEQALASADPAAARVADRSADDLYLLYTGGTTGFPKGVMWRHEDIYFASLGGRGTPSRGIGPVRSPHEVAERAVAGDPITRRLPLCPLMHGGAMWVALQTHLNGGCLVLSGDRHFTPDAALDLMADEAVELVMLIGDATARPIADALDAEPDRWDLQALQVVASGGAVLSPSVKARLRRRLAGVTVADTFGASETGGQGRLRAGAPGEPPRLITDADTAVLDDDGRPLPPGSDRIGRLARTGHIPLGYLNDPDKTAATFPIIDGRRWSVPGDLARLDADGTVVVLGRGALCINTGGEKVFPEEVERVLKQHPAVADALVVGVPHERLGQQVAAVVAARPGATVTVDALEAVAREHLAGYKVPRTWRFEPNCQRLPTGKGDYRWAATVLGGG